MSESSEQVSQLNSSVARTWQLPAMKPRSPSQDYEKLRRKRFIACVSHKTRHGARNAEYESWRRCVRNLAESNWEQQLVRALLPRPGVRKIPSLALRRPRRCSTKGSFPTPNSRRLKRES